MRNDRKKLIRAFLPEDATLSMSKLSITGLNSLTKLLVRNLRMSEVNLSLRGTSLDSNRITLIGVEIR